MDYNTAKQGRSAHFILVWELLPLNLHQSPLPTYTHHHLVSFGLEKLAGEGHILQIHCKRLNLWYVNICVMRRTCAKYEGSRRYHLGTHWKRMGSPTTPLRMNTLMWLLLFRRPRVYLVLNCSLTSLSMNIFILHFKPGYCCGLSELIPK